MHADAATRGVGMYGNLRYTVASGRRGGTPKLRGVLRITNMLPGQIIIY